MRGRLIGNCAIGLGVALAAATTLLAQRPAASPDRPTPAVLFNTVAATQSSVRLKQSLEALKKEYESTGAAFKAESERGNQLTEKLRTLKPGDPQFKPLQQEVAKLRADFELHGKRVTNDVRDREAKVYLAFSRELSEEITRFAQANRIPLVLRYDPTPPELTDPRMVMRDIQKLVVYQRGLEVTPNVMEAVNRRVGTSTATNRPAASAVRPVQR